MTIAKTDDPRYIRDDTSQALLNTDKVEYEKFVKDRAQALEIQRLSKQVASMQDDFSQIKSLLQQLVREK
jgi:hypothetical protein